MASPAPAIPALRAEGISKRFGAVVALDGVSVALARGECLALVGESGSGKSTLLRCFNRLVEPDTGRVEIDGDDARRIDPIDLRRRTGYVPQEGGLLPHWRVRRNVQLVPWLRGMDDPRMLADEALRLVGLDPERYGERWPRQLSGGQRQRVAIARALAPRPRLVLLDEPFGALDAITRADLQETFRRLRSQLRLTAVLITHDLHEAILLADRIAVLQAGKLEQLADAHTLLSAPATGYVRALLARSRVSAP